MNQWLVITFAIVYLLILFGIAVFFESSRKSWAKSLLNSPYIYALTMAIYCSAWTFYGSVGKAAADGIEFLAIYIGPTIGAFFMIPVLGKIIRISKFQRINSIADFISARYGKNITIGMVVTLLVIIGVIPYISLQIKAISSSFNLLVDKSPAQAKYFYRDSGFYFTLALGLFISFFGTRSSDASAQHKGLLGAIAFESIIKLIALSSVGIFVCFYLFDGPSDIFNQANNNVDLNQLFTIKPGAYLDWFFLIIASLLAFFFLPRQFQVAVIENTDEKNLNKTMWLLPLYLFLINLFILPIAFAGRIYFTGQNVNPDTFVLSLPLATGSELLSIFTFIGGFSAATGMIIVETIAISTMISNNLVMPIIVGIPGIKKKIDESFSQQIKWIRRIGIIFILVFAYLYEKNIAQYFSLVNIGLISFAAVSQFAPAMLIGLYWKQASKNGAIIGLLLGFSIWFYTLVFPSFVDAGFFDHRILIDGPFGLGFLNPHALFGLKGFAPLSHSIFWSLFFNLAGVFIGSIYSKRKQQELLQAEVFVNIHKHALDQQSVWRRTATIPDLRILLANFIGKKRANQLLAGYAKRNQIEFSEQDLLADPRLIDFSERILSGVIGAASARIMVSSVTKDEDISIDEVLKILEESQQSRELNKELRRKSIELQRATEALTQVNRQLKEVDQLKDEFLYTVTHELRTPLTSIRAMSELVQMDPEMPEATRQDFLDRVVKEIEHMSHLITQVLLLERFENGNQQLQLSHFDPASIVLNTIQRFETMADLKKVTLKTKILGEIKNIDADPDLLGQVLTNLVSNALKFTPEGGCIHILLEQEKACTKFTVEDNGKGIPEDEQHLLFNKFFQAKNQTLKKPIGSGLGLAICKRIIELHHGEIHLTSKVDEGTALSFFIPNFATENSLT
jgi:Na+/proline symporter/nitrogen-specific signal transduction histidine kinase